MKAIIIGTSLSGKTTLIKYLKSTTNLYVTEMDEILTELNRGKYPSDIKYKRMLTPKAISLVFDKPNIVFFTNTDYFSDIDLVKARQKGFKIIQLFLAKKELLERNSQRISEEAYEDMSPWLDGMLIYQTKIKKRGLVDKVINSNQSVEKLGEELLVYLSGTVPNLN